MNWIDNKINTLWLQIDYELMNLHESIQQEDIPAQIEAKGNLERLSKQLSEWESKRK
ncbi:hypothetical protein [Oceanobacillus caeni]|uniref:hypothetical protein n=1 Tax=Oceanobacillus caeni TaxID=405946 RepID=UPI0036281328